MINDSLIKLLDAAFLPLIKRYANDGEYLPGARAFTEAALSVFQQHVPSKRELHLLLVEVFRKHGYIFYEIPPVFEEAAQAVLNPSAFKWGDASTRKDEESRRDNGALTSPPPPDRTTSSDCHSEIRLPLAFGHGDIMGFIKNGTPNEQLLAKQYNELSDNFCGLAYELRAIEEAIKPVSVNLDVIYEIYSDAYNEHFDGNPDAGAVSSETAGIKAVLDAAGVKYVD